MTSPLALLPLEISTLSFTLFRIFNTDNNIEFITSYFAFILHLHRFQDNFISIIKNSELNWKYCLIISICIGYVLYGIFNESIAPFILLKGKDKIFVKVTKGDTLGENFILAEITHNMIVLTQGDERIEFKLFERKKHADNKKQ